MVNQQDADLSLIGQLTEMSCARSYLQGSNPPDIDSTNARGVSIRECVEHLLTAPSTGHGDGMSRAAAAHEQASEGEDEEEAWARRLREEASDDEGVCVGGGRWGRGGEAEEESNAWADWHNTTACGSRNGGANGETEEEWADRMWAEMLGRRRRATEMSSRECRHASTSGFAISRAEHHTLCVFAPFGSINQGPPPSW